ncbi:MAG: helix-turn-helix domain-containing protein [Candidatus Lambdaproteobacteria bacterium]|nr:helix-turn-helix domain-containing protein [Candidatus Lambdaproteobacteria bacterium]
MKPLKSQNLYEILGVSRYATHDEIRNAYELARHTYKDNSLATYSLFSDEENTEILRLITEAYQTLFNPEQRRRYDDDLLSEERRVGGGADTLPAERPAARVASGGGRARPAATPRSIPRRVPATAERVAPPEPAEPAARDAVPREPAVPTPRSEPASAGAEKAMADFVEGVARFNGEVLRQVRLKAGIELSELAERTKIRRAYLQYLEEENFEFLPAPVYIKGFITIIAKTLCLPPDRVAQEYMQNIPDYRRK